MHKILWTLALVVGCSEYGVDALVDANHPDDTDNGETDGETDLPPEDCSEAAAPDAYAPPITDDCTAEPEIGSWEPEVEWNWDKNSSHPGYNQVMSMPVAANLTDDNGDGAIDDGDIPDVVFTSFTGSGYRSPGALTALSGADGSELWSAIAFDGNQPYGTSGVAIADVDGSGPAIFVVTTGGLTAVNSDGTHRWTAALSSPPTYGMGHPAILDMEGDGTAEIVLGRTVINHDGTVRWVGTGGSGTNRHLSFPADLDNDGLAEVVAGNTVYNHDGSIRWQAGADGVPAVADLDGDGVPEIVTVTMDSGGLVTARNASGEELWSLSYPDDGGGPPTIADFDGDGEPEIGFAAEQFYRVIEGSDGTILWENSIQDASSKRTGSSVFDFEGDGAAEVVYSDEQNLWVFDGATGAVEMKWTDHASGTLYEYPIIVDIDNDGSSEILVASNNYAFSGSTGITVIGDATDSWAPARPIWNQHAYSITHINDDGTVPASATPNWLERNNFRAGNSEIRVGLDQPDLRPGPSETCLSECDDDRAFLWFSIENGGSGDAYNIPVSLYALDGSTSTLVYQEILAAMAPATQTWMGPIELTRESFGPDGLQVVVDDESAFSGHNDECLEDNNDTVLDAWPCPDGS